MTSLSTASGIKLTRGSYIEVKALTDDADCIYRLISNSVKTEKGVFQLHATSRYKGRNGSTAVVTSDMGNLKREIERVLDVFNRVPKEADNKFLHITFFFDDPKEPVIAFRPFFDFHFEIVEEL